METIVTFASDQDVITRRSREEVSLFIGANRVGRADRGEAAHSDGGFVSYVIRLGLRSRYRSWGGRTDPLDSMHKGSENGQRGEDREYGSSPDTV